MTSQILAQPINRPASSFGAYAPQSDLDLAVLMGPLLSVRMTLIDDAIGRSVDLVNLYVEGEPLQGQMLKRGVRLLGSGSGSDYAELLKRHLFEEADCVVRYNDDTLGKAAGRSV